MNCYIEVKRTDKCVSCHTAFKDKNDAIPVRIQDNMGYSISSMCHTCMDMVKEYQRKKALFKV